MTEPMARTVKDFCRAYGVGHTLTYELIANGSLVALKAGRRTLITEASAQHWFETMQAERRAIEAERKLSQQRSADRLSYKKALEEKLSAIKDLDGEETQVYRHYDKNRQLLYIGISLSAVGRLSQHKEQSHWFNDIATVKIEIFKNREAALRAEELAIIKERPLYNKTHNDPPVPPLSPVPPSVPPSKERSPANNSG